MKKIKAKVTAPIQIEDFAKEVLDFAKNDANNEDINLIKSEIEDMIEMLETWKAKNQSKPKRA